MYICIHGHGREKRLLRICVNAVPVYVPSAVTSTRGCGSCYRLVYGSFSFYFFFPLTIIVVIIISPFTLIDHDKLARRFPGMRFYKYNNMHTHIRYHVAAVGCNETRSAAYTRRTAFEQQYRNVINVAAHIRNDQVSYITWL